MRRTAGLIVEYLLDGADTAPIFPPDLPEPGSNEPLSPRWEVQDVALDYMEGEVGRHDWKRNWQDHKRKHGVSLKEKVAAWLKHFEINLDPQLVLDYLDKELSSRDGKWL